MVNNYLIISLFLIYALNILHMCPKINYFGMLNLKKKKKTIMNISKLENLFKLECARLENFILGRR